MRVLHYAVCEHSTAFSNYLEEHEFSLTAKTEERFIEALFKALSSLYDYRAPLNKVQFFSKGRFAELKMMITNYVLKIVRAKEREMKRPKRKLGRRANSVNRYQIPENTAGIQSNSRASL